MVPYAESTTDIFVDLDSEGSKVCGKLCLAVETEGGGEELNLRWSEGCCPSKSLFSPITICQGHMK